MSGIYIVTYKLIAAAIFNACVLDIFKYLSNVIVSLVVFLFQNHQMCYITDLACSGNSCLADMAEAAFHLCAYEFAIKTVNSPWCQLIDEIDAQVQDK